MAHQRRQCVDFAGLRDEFGQDPDLEEVYDHVVRIMQDTLDALAAERRLPVLG